jgi:hypothetical protein
MRDLTDEAPNAIAAARSRVATEGWGAKLLALQSPVGYWGGPNEDLTTLYTLVLKPAFRASFLIWRAGILRPNRPSRADSAVAIVPNPAGQPSMN